MAIDFNQIVTRSRKTASTFKEHEDRIEVLIDKQCELWKSSDVKWGVIPLTVAEQVLWFYVAGDNESERRGREIITAFLLPAFAEANPVNKTIIDEFSADTNLVNSLKFN